MFVVFFLLVMLAVVYFSMYAGYYFCRNQADDGISGVMCLALAAALLLLFSILSAEVYENGSPVSEIAAGEYKVGFIYVAGENINVALEQKWGKEEGEHIYLYQFNRGAFEGVLNPNAKKLVVVQSGSFKKLRLE